MREPIWISKEFIFALHERLVAEFGGTLGLRDEGLLDSALHRPKHLFSYGSSSRCELAAAYAFGLVKNHPFLDGNKRVGFTAAATFLEINGYRIVASEVDATAATLALAEGKMKQADYAAWLKANTSRELSRRRRKV